MLVIIKFFIYLFWLYLPNMHKGQNLECFACEPPYPPPIMQKGQFFYKT
jgi:hypothetical protein